jgi:predicted MFS family arabinose efflux permease
LSYLETTKKQAVSKWHNVTLLALAQSLFQTSSILVVTLSGMVGLELAADKSLATLPIAMISVGTATMLIPASHILRKLGTKSGFMIGTLMGILAGLLAAYAILNRSFWLFIVANMFIGYYQGFAQYYRFAAADTVPGESKGRAISIVLMGGIVAAIAGPNLARYTQHVGEMPFAASYLSIAVLGAIAFLVMLALRPSPTNLGAPSAAVQVRPVLQIMRQKKAFTAVTSSVIGYAVMVMVMTATPLAMHTSGHTHDDAALVIQWHVLGMFVPSFFTGALIDRFGVRTIILAGTLILGLHVTFALTGTDFLNFVSGLIFLGVGWNFLFIGGTTLLTRSYLAGEAQKTQAFHDFVVFGATTISSFSAGSILNHYGWTALNMAVIPLLLLVLVVLAKNRDVQNK